MPLPIGSHIGAYAITGTLGAGGMGEVYRARDSKLGRDVALKILPDAFAADPDRLARFQREAQVLASLNHPHIGAIYGLEDSGEIHALVLELVEGDTLADRIARGPLSTDEAVPMARQIAEALEAAHEQGVIHRDLKPANIKVTPDGAVKVLDFGLAKLHAPNGPHAPNDPNGRSLSPTITSPVMMTGVGTLLGTAAYMSPEQAKGREADKRSDVWAFGCVLYEMLTGARPFDGEDTTDVLGAVVRLEPNWAAIPADVPPAIRTLLLGCLIKDRRRRVGDISTALFVLEQAASLAAPVGTASAAPLRRPLWRRVVAPMAAALIAAAVVGTATWFATRPAAQTPPRVSRLPIGSSGTAAMTISTNNPVVAITPDGSRIVYVGNRGTQLFVRALDTFEPVAVYTGSPRGPFVSPDGEWIGFIDNQRTLKRVSINGGPADTLATLDAGPRGATWAPDDTIIIATGSTAAGLQRIAPTGGPATVLTRPDNARGEADHLFPALLPGGRAVLFTIIASTGGLDAARVAVLDLQTRRYRVLWTGGSNAHYVPSGHLVYAAAGTLRAVAFDLDRLEIRGRSVPVVPRVMTTVLGAAYVAVAGDGTLVYVAGSVPSVPRSLVWVDREGNETPIPAPPRTYAYPRLSPDGRRVAAFANDQEQDIWTWELGRGPLTRVSFGLPIDTAPQWMSNDRVVSRSERSRAGNLFWWAADGGSNAPERLTDSPNAQVATAVSDDGRRLIFTETRPNTGDDVMQLDLGSKQITALVASPYTERNGVVSPDGRWLAFETNESGPFEIVVRPLPDVDSGHWTISTGGGTRPLWARRGKELFYTSPTGALMRVGMERGPSAATSPMQVVKEGYRTLSAVEIGRQFDVSLDGKRFLLVKAAENSDQGGDPIVVQGWADDLKRLVPTN